MAAAIPSFSSVLVCFVFVILNYFDLFCNDCNLLRNHIGGFAFRSEFSCRNIAKIMAHLNISLKSQPVDLSADWQQVFLSFL